MYFFRLTYIEYQNLSAGVDLALDNLRSPATSGKAIESTAAPAQRSRKDI